MPLPVCGRSLETSNHLSFALMFSQMAGGDLAQAVELFFSLSGDKGNGGASDDNASDDDASDNRAPAPKPPPNANEKAPAPKPPPQADDKTLVSGDAAAALAVPLAPPDPITTAPSAAPAPAPASAAEPTLAVPAPAPPPAAAADASAAAAEPSAVLGSGLGGPEKGPSEFDDSPPLFLTPATLRAMPSVALVEHWSEGREQGEAWVLPEYRAAFDRCCLTPQAMGHSRAATTLKHLDAVMAARPLEGDISTLVRTTAPLKDLVLRYFALTMPSRRLA
jgi:hypothetical protein